MDEESKQYLGHQFGLLGAKFDQVDAKLGQLEAKFDQVDAKLGQLEAKFAQMDSNFTDVYARIEKSETNLLRAFHGWARSMEIRQRNATGSVAGFDERLVWIEERVSELERKK